jgi:uncharacterized protein (TIGR00730 family)
MSTTQSVCVYCGSSPGRSPIYLESGRALGHALAEAGLRLVYGGGTRGIMGAVSAGVIEKGGKVTGIIPTFLPRKPRTARRTGWTNCTSSTRCIRAST